MPILLQINSDANWGSTGKIAEMIGQVALSNGWQSYIAYGRDNNPSQLQVIKVGNKLSVYIHYLLYRFFDFEGLGSIIPTFRLISKIKQIKPDIIHLHNIHGHYLNYPILFKFLKKIKVPVVWTLHDCWTMTGHCYLYDCIECDRWKTGCHHCPKSEKWSLDNSKFNYRLKKKYFRSLENVHIITVSDWLGSLVKESFLNKFPVKTIYNGIDLNVFKPSFNSYVQKERLDNKMILLAVASVWSNYKGLSDYIKLSELLSDEYKLVLVGLSESQIHQLPSRIIGIKRTQSQVELVELYSAASVVLSLSYGESLGLTPIEGMACGTPAIVYNNTAQPELVTPETGSVVETGDIEGVKRMILNICSKGKDSYKEDCQKRVRDIFSSSNSYGRYFSLYESLLKQPSSHD